VIKASIVASVLALTPATAYAQTSHASHRVPAIPQELLERTIPLRAGIGSAHDAVSTTSPQAQAFYDQGIALLHSYAWIDAARSFHEALRLDPSLAMAHLGLSFAYEEVNKPAAARTALERAVVLAGGASSHERRHIEIRSMQLRAAQTPAAGVDLTDYRRALDEAVAAFPSDVELWLLRGIAESPDPADRGQGSPQTSIRFYERVLAIRADHFAAHHYLIHAYENAGRIDDALKQAEEYVRLAPAIPHAHHMLGHDLRRVGRIDAATAAFQKAYELETDPSRAAQVPPAYDWHHQHNLDLLATSHQYVGQMGTAARFMRMSFQIPSPLVVQEFNKHEWPAFLLARGRADDARAAADVLKTSPATVVRGIGHVMTGRALLAQRRFAEAAEASNLALRELRSAGPEASLAAPYLQSLQAEFFLRTGDREKALVSFREVRRKIRALPGPDGWSQGLFRLESIGRVAVESGAWELAAETSADMMAHDASYGGTQYIAALVAEHRGDREATLRHLELADRAWRAADPDFGDVADVRGRIARMKVREIPEVR
jgi:tetratricopeptide (TPR) repeat protein